MEAIEQQTDRRPWDQMPDESDAAYARFLVYRNLGPKRSVLQAYRAWMRLQEKEPGDSGRVPGSFQRDSAAFAWIKRAEAWDIFNLLEIGTIATQQYLMAIRTMANRTFEALESQEAIMRPLIFEEVIKALDLLSKIISKEAVDAWFARQRDNYEDAAAKAAMPSPSQPPG